MHTSRTFASTRLNTVIFSTVLSCACPVAGQEFADDREDAPAKLEPPARPADSDNRATGIALPAVENTHVRFKNSVLILGETLGLAWYGKRKWWRDGFEGRFRRVNEGWFGQDTYAGGADKAGHYFANYAGSRLLAKTFRQIGNDPDQALYLGAALTLGTMTAVEVIDGYSKRWRFSREDAVMNLLGAGTAVLFERYPRLDDVVDLRFHYQPSAAEGKRFDPFSDYSGQTYLVVLKASGIPALRDHRWLRYLELAAGYGSRDYVVERPDLVDQRRRQAYFGISLNLSELLGQTVFKNAPPDRPARQAVETALEYVQVPGTAVFGRRQLPAR
jgi:hypothetical protein